MKIKALLLLIVYFSAFSNSVCLGSEAVYHIGPGDLLEISVWKDESLSKQVVVPPDGFISFPLIGDVDVSGMTVADLRKHVADRLTEYIPDVTVTVMFLEISSLRAYVIGKVNNPGEFPINIDTNVMQILSMAGGLDPFASSGEILVIRQENKATMKIPFNYKEVAKGKNLEQNIIIRRGDVVVVP